MGALGGGLFFERDFFGKHACLGHNAETYGVTCADESIARAVGEGFAFACEALKLAFGTGGSDLTFGESVEPGHFILLL